MQALTVLEYCLYFGSENVVTNFQENRYAIYFIKTLMDFSYVDENRIDHGANVRLKAQSISYLIRDESRLRRERQSKAQMRDHPILSPVDDGQVNQDLATDESYISNQSRAVDGDDELRRAIKVGKSAHIGKTASSTGAERIPPTGATSLPEQSDCWDDIAWARTTSLSVRSWCSDNHGSQETSTSAISSDSYIRSLLEDGKSNAALLSEVLASAKQEDMSGQNIQVRDAGFVLTECMTLMQARRKFPKNVDHCRVFCATGHRGFPLWHKAGTYVKIDQTQVQEHFLFRNISTLSKSMRKYQELMKSC